MLPAVIIGAAALAGSAINASSQSKTNKQNMQINQMNNDFNERMLDKQIAYNTEMWNKENEYNTPLNQRKRLEDAGFNPYMMMGNVSSGSASSANGVNPPTGSPIPMQPVKHDIAQAAEMVGRYQMQKETADAQNNYIGMQSDWYAVKSLAEIQDKLASADDKQSRAIWQKIQNNYADQLAQSQYRQSILNNQQTEETIRNIQAQNMMMSKELSIFDYKSRLELSNFAAEIKLKVEQGRLTRQQGTTEVYKRMQLANQAEGNRISNYILKSSAESLIQKNHYDSFMSGVPNNLWSLAGAGFKQLYDRGRDFLK